MKRVAAVSAAHTDVMATGAMFGMCGGHAYPNAKWTSAQHFSQSPNLLYAVSNPAHASVQVCCRRNPRTGCRQPWRQH